MNNEEPRKFQFWNDSSQTPAPAGKIVLLITTNGAITTGILKQQGDKKVWRTPLGGGFLSEAQVKAWMLIPQLDF